MELKWTGKALSDLARLYDFLAPVNKAAAARAVQALAKAPTILLTSPRIGENCSNSSRARYGGSSWATTRCATKYRAPISMCCACGTPGRIVEHGTQTVGCDCPRCLSGGNGYPRIQATATQTGLRRTTVSSGGERRSARRSGFVFEPWFRSGSASLCPPSSGRDASPCPG